MAEYIDLPDFVRGDTWANKLTFTAPAGGPQDVTGWQFWLTLKLDDAADDADAPAQVSVVASGAEAVAGEVYLTLTPDVTETLLPTRYRYDTQVSSGAGLLRTLVIGRVRVTADVTRSR